MPAFHLIFACGKINYMCLLNIIFYVLNRKFNFNLYIYWILKLCFEKIFTLFTIYFIKRYSLMPIARRPIAAPYIGLGAYSINHVDAFSFTSNQAALAQIKNACYWSLWRKRFLLNATNMYSAVVAMPTKQGNFGLQIDYFGFKNYNESQIGLAYARSLGSKLILE